MVDLAAAVHAVARDPRRRPEVALAVRVVHATPGRIPLGAPIVLKTVLRRDEVERAREEVAEDECNYEEVQHLEVVLRHDERVLEAREHPVHPQKLEDLERPHESHRLEELKVPHEVHVAIEAPPLVVRLRRRRQRHDVQQQRHDRREVHEEPRPQVLRGDVPPVGQEAPVHLPPLDVLDLDGGVKVQEDVHHEEEVHDHREDHDPVRLARPRPHGHLEALDHGHLHGRHEQQKERRHVPGRPERRERVQHVLRELAVRLRLLVLGARALHEVRGQRRDAVRVDRRALGLLLLPGRLPPGLLHGRPALVRCLGLPARARVGGSHWQQQCQGPTRSGFRRTSVILNSASRSALSRFSTFVFFDILVLMQLSS